jgi:phospholipid/cholesterol/gamma-HCH transport system substrate-binding protein
VVRALAEARVGAGDRWPGTTLPDIGQLTAQASRIAGDIGVVTDRVQSAVDTQAINNIRGSVRDLRTMASQLLSFTQQQTTALSKVVDNASTSSNDIAAAARHLDVTLSRVDSSTASGEVSDMIREARAATSDIRTASGDLKLLAGTAQDQRERLVRIMTNTDAMLTRLNRGEGSLGLFLADSTLYRETTKSVIQLRTLLQDIQTNPRRYFHFSVF